MNGRRGAYRVLVWRPVRKKALGRPKSRWEYNNKFDVQEVRWRAGLYSSGSG
jgi:hypothetical protein